MTSEDQNDEWFETLAKNRPGAWWDDFECRECGGHFLLQDRILVCQVCGFKIDPQDPYQHKARFAGE
jgi:hypothetical protein